MRKIMLAGCVLTAMFVAQRVWAANPGGDAIVGLWLTEGGKARVEVVRGNDGYDGRIVWLKEPRYPADDPQHMGGQPKVDRENPDKSLHGRPIIGLPLAQDFHYAGDNRWEGGSIYDPESGKTYRCKMTLLSDGTLKVRGYVGISLFGRTTVWTRVISPPG